MPPEKYGAGPPLPRPPADGDFRERAAMWREFTLDLLRARPALRNGLVVALSAAVGVFGWVILSGRPSSIALEDALPTLAATEASQQAATPEAAPNTIIVHVAGAVAQPGLVELAAGARVADAVAEAGGPVATADLDRVNLASLVSDGDRIAIPAVGEDAPDLVESRGEGGETGPVDLNSATVGELEALPGVGPATAGAILTYREENGPFESVTALDAVPGIGPAKLDQLRPLVTVGS